MPFMPQDDRFSLADGERSWTAGAQRVRQQRDGGRGLAGRERDVQRVARVSPGRVGGPRVDHAAMSSNLGAGAVDIGDAVGRGSDAVVAFEPPVSFLAIRLVASPETIA